MSISRDQSLLKADPIRGKALALGDVGKVIALLWFMCTLGLASLVFPGYGSSSRWRVLAVGFFLAGGSTLVGSAVGFLFGVPRHTTRVGSRSSYVPNTNLERISDWLTKIIVGLGLVELRNLPERMKVIASPLATSLGEPSGLAVAVGIIVFASFAGFLIGYINSRTFLAVLFSGYDDLGQQVEELKDDLKETAAKQEAQKVVSDVQFQGIRTLVSAQGGLPTHDLSLN